MVILLVGLSADAPGSIRPAAAAPTPRLWACRKKIFEEIFWWPCGYLLDTSAVVKRYVQETGTIWINNLTNPAAGHFLYVAWITDVEMTAAIARRRRLGSLSISQAGAALNRFAQDFDQEYRITELTIPLLRQAAQLADRHVLRAYDAVQLTAATNLNAQWVAAGIAIITLVSADQELNAAAVAEGLPIEDPNQHP